MFLWYWTTGYAGQSYMPSVFPNDHSVKLFSLKNTQLFETLSFPNKVSIAFALMYVLVSIRIGFIKFKKKKFIFFFPLLFYENAENHFES